MVLDREDEEETAQGQVSQGQGSTSENNREITNREHEKEAAQRRVSHREVSTTEDNTEEETLKQTEAFLSKKITNSFLTEIKKTDLITTLQWQKISDPQIVKKLEQIIQEQ